MVFFKVRLPRRRQLKVHLNHRNFEQVKQADRLDQNGDGTSTKHHEAGTVEFPPFTHGESPMDSTRLQERKTDHGNGVTYKRPSSVVDLMSRESPACSCKQDSPRSKGLWESQRIG